MSVPSSELAPHAHTPASKCVPHLEPGGQHPLVGEGAGGGHFGRLERKPGTLYSLWEKPFVVTENPFNRVIPIYQKKEVKVVRVIGRYFWPCWLDRKWGGGPCL